jgi:spermidine/putrescine transport system ATP-binding protein
LSDAQRDAALEDLQTLAREKNLAVVFATNDYEEAFTVCDRICVLHKGQIVQVGTPRELYEKPINAAVGGIMGRNNFIKARRVTFNNEQTQEFQTIEGNHRLLIGKVEKNVLGTITNDVLLAIRPEHISISFGASFPEDNLLRSAFMTGAQQHALNFPQMN